MKNISKKTRDVLAEVKNSPRYARLEKNAEWRIKFAIQVYNQREKIGLSQRELAKKIDSTQKVVSKIENGDVNVGIDLINRLADALQFDIENWSKTFSFIIPKKIVARV